MDEKNMQINSKFERGEVNNAPLFLVIFKIAAVSFCLGFLFFGISSSVQASMIVEPATYYVDATDGLDSNDGITVDTPWKTIAQVNASYFNGGDFILFKRGEMWRERITPQGSGSEESVITFGAYGTGANPIIRGSTLISGSWTSLGDGVYSIQPIGWARDSESCWQDTTTGLVKGSSAVLSAGQFWIDVSTTPDTLYVRTTDSADPTTHTIELASIEEDIYPSSNDYLVFENLTLQHGDSFGGVRNYLSSNNTFQNLEFAYTGGSSAITITSGSNTIIQNCTIHDAWNGKAYGSGGSGQGIVAISGTIRYNTIYNVYSGIGVNIGPGSVFII